MLFQIDIRRDDVEHRLDTLTGVNVVNNGTSIIVSFKFDVMRLHATGPEVLAIKKLLKNTLTAEQNSENVDASDGPHFDARMELALAGYQAANAQGIKDILTNKEGRSDVEAAFESEFKTVGTATLAHMYGWINNNTGGFYAYEDSELYKACANVVDQAIAMSEEQARNLDSAVDALFEDETTTTSTPAQPSTEAPPPPPAANSPSLEDPNSSEDLFDFVRDLDRRSPGLNPRPQQVDGRVIEMAIRTRYSKVQGTVPPELRTAEQLQSFFSSIEYRSLESEALQRVFAYFNKSPTFTLRNDALPAPGTAQMDFSFTEGQMVSAFPFLANLDPGRDVTYNIIDTDSPQYFPNVEREQTGTGHRNGGNNLISYRKLASTEDVYLIIFDINKAKLEAITTAPGQGREFNIDEAYREVKETYNDVKEITDKIGLTGDRKFLQGINKDIDRMADRYEKRWNDAKSEFQRKSTKDQLSTIHNTLDKKFGINNAIRRQTLANRYETSRKAASAAWKSRITSLPSPGESTTRDYDLSGLNNRVRALSEKMSEYHLEYVQLSAGGRDLRFDPPVNLESEGQRLITLSETIEGLISSRGKNPKKNHLRITFKGTSDGKGVSITKLVIVKKKKVDDVVTDVPGSEFVLVGPNINQQYSPLKASPYTDRIAVGYLFGLNNSYGELFGENAVGRVFSSPPGANVGGPVSEFLKKCKEVTNLGAMIFIAKYRFPVASVVTSNKLNKYRKNKKPDWDIDTNIPGRLRTFKQKAEKSAKDTKNKVKNGDFFSIRKGKVFRIQDEFPLGELCNLEDLYNEFINKFKLQALICDMVACIPDLPPFPTNLKLDIPELPDLPTFDPMAIIVPVIEAALMDLYKQFLCALVNAILDIVREPTCDDLYDLAAKGLVNLIDLIKEATSKRNLDEKLTMVDTLRNSGIPPEAFASEDGLGQTPNTISSLFNDISDMLTVTQLCSLLQGRPSQNTLDIIEIVIAEKHPQLASYFYGTEDIKTVFTQLGSLIDPEVCSQIIEAAEANQTVEICDDDSSAEKLKKALEERGTAKEEIQRAIDFAKEEAMKRNVALKALLSDNPLEKLLENANIPASPANEIPNFLKDMINNRIGALAESVRTSLHLDSRSFVDGLYDQLSVPLKQGDPRYNSFLAYKYYRAVALLAKIANDELLGIDDATGQLDVLNVWTAREYLFADNTIFENNEDLSRSPREDRELENFLFPDPPPEGSDPVYYRVGDVDLDGENLKGFLFKPSESIDIANTKRKAGRPFAPPILTGILVANPAEKNHTE